MDGTALPTMGVTRGSRVQRRMVALLSFSAVFLQLAQYAAGAAEEGAPMSLQRYLDMRCQEIFDKLCRGGDRSFCDPSLSAVARKGLGIPGQDKPEWRCYDKTAVSGENAVHEEIGVLCVDNCGNELPCNGFVRRSAGNFHATRHWEITDWIKKVKKDYCSPLQEKFDRFCKDKYADTLGRIMGPSNGWPWVCAPKTILNFNEDGKCFNHCGLSSKCPGSPMKKPHGDLLLGITQQEKARLQLGFRRPCRPFERCEQALGEPPVCTEDQAPPLPPEDTLQKWLDSKCVHHVKHHCEKRPEDPICTVDANIVLRKGLGTGSNGQIDYHCYAESSLKAVDLVNISKHGLQCLDDCGYHVRCGGTVDLERTPHLPFVNASHYVDAGKTSFCSKFQQAVQHVCDIFSKNLVARHGVSSTNDPAEPVDANWRCVDPTTLVWTGVGYCFNNCGGIKQCPGGRTATNHVEYNSHLLSPKDVDGALADVNNPCSLTQLCKPTTRNPPACVDLGPTREEEEEEEGEGDRVLSEGLGEGEVLIVAFNSPHVTVRVGKCFRAELDLQHREVEVGRGENTVALRTDPTQPPYTVSLQRAGLTVTLILHYSSDASAGNSLFYVHPSADCVSSAEVTFAGLEKEARLTKSSVKDIASAAP